MSAEFLVATLIIGATPGAGVPFTRSAGRSNATRATEIRRCAHVGMIQDLVSLRPVLAAKS
ncbi:MAG: hypothetical protein H0V73_12870 [Chloroflexi bacterium]|nr:hypothetical protein [Chloroflexota bacterium]